MGGSVPTLGNARTSGPLGRTMPLDATLGVDGLPQSGTGQTALLTGENAADLQGRHFGPWVPVALRPLVEGRSVLQRALDAGRSAAFANAYPGGWPAAVGGAASSLDHRSRPRRQAYWTATSRRSAKVVPFRVRS